MKEIIQIRDLSQQALADFTSGAWVAGGKKVLSILGIGLDTASDLGFRAVPESADIGGDPTTTAGEALKCLKECQAQVKIVKDPNVRNPAVGKLGDGVFLSKLLDAAVKALELWLKIAP